MKAWVFLVVGLMPLRAAAQPPAEAEAGTVDPPDEASPEASEPEEPEEAPADEASAEVPEPALPSDRWTAALEMRMARAVELFEAGDFDQALTEFRALEEASLGTQRHGAVLFNMARAYERLFQYDAAMTGFERYAHHIGPDGEYYGAVVAKIESLEALLGTLRFEVTPATYEVWIDGRRIDERRSELRIPGGRLEIELRAPGHASALREVELTAGGDAWVRATLEPLAEEYRGLSPTYFWLGLSVGLATAAAAAIAGILAVIESGSERDCAADRACALESLGEDASRGENTRTLTVVADVLGLSSVAILATAAALAFVTDFGSDGPELRVGPGGARLRVRF
ncbi:MAG: hypothetical protein AAGF12_09905 [Myxococcota bacterium]